MTINDNTFKSYVVSDNASGANGSAVVNFLTPADITSASPSWYWLSKGNGNVSVKVDVYVNVGGGYSGLPLNTIINITTITDTRPVTVWNPNNSCSPTPGTINIIAISKYAIELTGYDPGIKWTGSVVPQTLFGTSASGSWHYVQVVQPNASYFKAITGHRYELSINGQVGLDDTYPYGADPDNLNDAFNSNDGTGWKDNNTSYYSQDSPSMGLTNDITNASVNHQFWTYMMYKPQNGTWVSLHRIAWNFNVGVTQPVNGWASALGPTGSNVVVTEDKPYTTHPTWQQVLFASAPFN